MDGCSKGVIENLLLLSARVSIAAALTLLSLFRSVTVFERAVMALHVVDLKKSRSASGT